MDQGT